MLRPPVSSPGHRQRGAAAVFAAISLIALITMMALAIDVGRLYFAQRDLQRLANIAALDAVRVASGCTTEGRPGSLAQVLAEVQASLTRNRDAQSTVGVTPVAEVGKKRTNQGLREFEVLDESDKQRNAVRVTLSRQTPSRIFPLISNSAAQTLTAVSVAEQPALGSFSIGSTVASVSGGLLNQVLAGLLCAVGDAPCQASVIALNVASATTGLADVGISANQLSTALGVSVEDLSDPLVLETMTPVLDDVLSGLSSSLSGTASGAITGLLGALGSAASNGNPIPLGDIIPPVSGVDPDAPLINLLDLLMALGQAANSEQAGVNAVLLPLQLNAGVATVDTYLKVLEPPQPGFGAAGVAEARTASVRLMLRISVLPTLTNAIRSTTNTLTAAAGFLGLPVPTVNTADPINLGIDVAVAPSIARLDTLQCPVAGVNDGMPIAGLSVQTGIATVTVGSFNSATPTTLLPVSAVPLASIGIDGSCVRPLNLPLLPCSNLGTTNLSLALDLTASLGSPGGGYTDLDPIADFDRKGPVEAGSYGSYVAHGGPDSDKTSPDNPQTTASPVGLTLGLNLSQSQTGSGLIGGLGGLVSSILGSINTLLQPLVNTVSGLTLSRVTPVLNSLGISLGSATVTMNSVTVAQPDLVTVAEPTP